MSYLFPQLPSAPKSPLVTGPFPPRSPIQVPITTTRTTFPMIAPKPLSPTIVPVQVPNPLPQTLAHIHVPKPLSPATFPVQVPKPLNPATFPVQVPKPLSPATFPVQVPKPLSPATFPVQVPKPLTPTIGQVQVPKPLTRPQVPNTMIPTVVPIQVPKTLTQPQVTNTVIPTVVPIQVPKTLTQPQVPKPSTPIGLQVEVTKTLIPTAMTGIGEPVLPIFQVQIPTPQPVPGNNIVTFTPETINEDTIVSMADKLDKISFYNLLKLLGDAYHNDEGLVSDEIYDELVDMYEAKYGDYNVVGAEPTGEKVQLPYYLGSLRKLKEEKELDRWLEQHPGPYIVMDKIDGLTLLDTNEIIMGRKKTTLLTRGGGYRGKDVSHLLPYIKIAQTNNSVRGEIVMTNEAFARVGAGFKNPRNLTSGIVNAQKQFNPTLARELSFYAYRIMNKNNSASQDIAELQSEGFLVPNPVAAETLTIDILRNYYNMRKEQAPYDMDGLVIYQDIPLQYPEGDAPRHVVAFKTGTPTGVTTVTHVSWRASKDKLLKPIVHYESIDLSGASLVKASGYNARYVVTNNIGPGAKILLTRSGDVIPKILSVIEPSPNGPDYPDPNVHGNYGWNENQVEFVVTENNAQVAVGKLKHFLDTLDVKNAGRKRVEAMVAAGILTIDILLSITPQQLAGIPGIGPTLSNQFYNDIHDRVTNVSAARIMDASGIFPHVGERRFEMILNMYPNFLDLARRYRHEPTKLQGLIRGVRGFNKLAEEIVKNINIFIDWLDAHPMITVENPIYHVKAPNFPIQLQIGQETTLPAMQPPILSPTQLQIGLPPTTQQFGTNTLAGVTVVFSGFRDREMEDKIRRLGGKVTTSVSRNTTFLIMKDVSDVKGKAKQAQEKGVQLISKDQFERQYL